jgi:UDP-N-acetylglucosamine 2-epimerase (non-hydrolysing)
MTRRIDVIAGARPNFMKIAPIMRAFAAHAERQEAATGSSAGGSALRLVPRLVHTGQHYDRRMSADFFEQLGIPEPEVNLECGSGTQAEQTAAIMTRYERLLAEAPAAACVVVGDVTSTMACAIVARKMGVPVAHVEAGIRSGDWSMPEEINRVVTDSITNWYFTTSEVANANLRKSGAAESCIFFVGNTMIDTLLANLGRLREPQFWASARLEPGKYLVLTLHRPANVDDPASLRRLLDTIVANARGRTIVFPVHPRTAKSVAAIGGAPEGMLLVEPQPYLEFIHLVKHSAGVITDSGGITEETTVMAVPCMTLRDSTERPETVTMGTNELIGTDPAAIPPAMGRLMDGKWKSGAIPPLWDGRTGERIVAHLISLLAT